MNFPHELRKKIKGENIYRAIVLVNGNVQDPRYGVV